MKVLDIVMSLLLLVYGFILMFGCEKYIVDQTALDAIFCILLSGLISRTSRQEDKMQDLEDDGFFDDYDDLE